MMNPFKEGSVDKQFASNALEATIHVGIVLLLLFWCFKIAQPFIEIFFWGIIIAVAIQPAYQLMLSISGKRPRLAAVLLTLLLLLILILPSLLFVGSLVDTAEKLSDGISRGTLKIPAAPEHIRSWPAIGESLYNFWRLSSENLLAALGKIAPQIKDIALWLVNKAAGTGFSIIKFIVAILISGVLLANGEACVRVAGTIAVRLAGDRGMELVALSGSTVRSVSRGILGVAIIQSILAGIGCLAAGVPAAGLWALVVLILAVIQMPTLLILGPLVIYVFYAGSTFAAVLFTVWCVLVGMCDTFLKPVLMGRGASVPMLVVFIGAIGGFMLSGIIGLFLGAVVLSLGFNLFQAWLQNGKLDEAPE